MLAQHLHHPAVQGEELVVVLCPRIPLPIGNLEHGVQAVGERHVGAEDPEIALLLIEFCHISQEHAQFMCVGCLHGSRGGHFHRVFAKVRHDQVVQQQTVSLRFEGFGMFWLAAVESGAV